MSQLLDQLKGKQPDLGEYRRRGANADRREFNRVAATQALGVNSKIAENIRVFVSSSSPYSSSDWVTVLPKRGVDRAADTLNSSYTSTRRDYAVSLSLLANLTAQSESENPLQAEFRALADQWRKETGMLSMVHKKAMHPAYQRIIGMGRDALPLIFKELQERGGHWIWALRSITGIEAASPQHNLRQATEAWLAWGRNNGYI